ncbi:oxidoreductase [Parafrankia colletiae]|uniref:Oxidoreductase n=1 Tax=Parafrankia colletiae TaxID=573497 RepID=A0A1S1QUE5_9ACTN|nr:aldo/keto reductase [Parafrankia colletiae]MCK9904119.1 aldo/keto reductase [Frankia sp. Cpl3]OHV36915.1 oxidoreductase [Parafrankia colletiae]
MSTQAASPSVNAAASGTFLLGGDLQVNRLGYGAMQITGPGIWGPPANRDEALAVLRRAVDLGVNFIDTADSYGPEVSEDLIAEALYPYPDGLVIATKGGLTRQGPGQWTAVGRAEYLRQQVEMSLRRLRVERIDLYQLHRIDPKVPVEESIGELRALQEEGKIRHIGVSEVSVAELKQTRSLAEIVSVQNRYNLADRAAEDVLDYAEREGIGFIPWFPIATGELARPGGVLDEASKRHGSSPSQLALAWLLRRSPVMLPIPGTSSVAHLEENVAAAGVTLTDAEYDDLVKVAG